jgi:hypothetical protein
MMNMEFLGVLGHMPTYAMWFSIFFQGLHLHSDVESRFRVAKNDMWILV